MKSIPYGLHWIDEGDIEEVVKVLRSDWITGGPKSRNLKIHCADISGADMQLL